MRLIKSSSDQVNTPTAIALGNFDGIHLGHQKVIRSICTCLPTKEKEEYLARRKGYLPVATVVTFNPHPREFFSGERKQLLTPLPEKLKLLENLGIKQLVLLPFDRELAALKPRQFVEQILVKKLQTKQISIGADFRFGHQRSGDAHHLQKIAADWGIEVLINSLQTREKNRVSSSQIRHALAVGNVSQANEMLGRAYTLTGKVVKGQQLGRKLGFPTANLEISADKLLPRYGVYGVKVEILSPDNSRLKILNGVMNIGCRPTVAGENPSVEVYILDWRGDIYNATLTVSLEQFIRPEQKFASLEDLKVRIKEDCQQVRKILEV